MVSTLTEIGAAAGGSAGVEIVVAATLIAAKGLFLRRAWILWVIPVDKAPSVLLNCPLNDRRREA